MQTCPNCRLEVGEILVRGGPMRCPRCRFVFGGDQAPAASRGGSRTGGETTGLSSSGAQAQRPEPTDPIEAVLRVTEGVDRGRVFKVRGREIIVGRSAGDVSLSDPEVSRHHVVLQGLGGRCLLRDLGSTNGTYVDGLRVAETFVIAGQDVAVGKTVLRLLELHGLPAGG